jgi:hypothetical protein
MDAGLFFVVTSPEVMAKTDTVIKNLLKIVGARTCMFSVVSSLEIMAEADAVIENLLKVW